MKSSICFNYFTSVIYDQDVSQDIFVLQENQRTRGHNKRISKERLRLNKSRNSFCQRIVNNWNQLPRWVIDSDSVKRSEANLDKAWRGQEIYFNYRAKIHHRATFGSTSTTMQPTYNPEPDAQA